MNIMSARCANEVQILEPFNTNSSPSIAACVWSDAKSEPVSGSEYPWHHCIPPDAISGRYRFFCASVPKRIRVGPSIRVPNLSFPGARR